MEAPVLSIGYIPLISSVWWSYTMCVLLWIVNMDSQDSLESGGNCYRLTRCYIVFIWKVAGPSETMTCLIWAITITTSLIPAREVEVGHLRPLFLNTFRCSVTGETTGAVHTNELMGLTSNSRPAKCWGRVVSTQTKVRQKTHNRVSRGGWGPDRNGPLLPY